MAMMLGSGRRKRKRRSCVRRLSRKTRLYCPLFSFPSSSMMSGGEGRVANVHRSPFLFFIDFKIIFLAGQNGWEEKRKLFQHKREQASRDEKPITRHLITLTYQRLSRRKKKKSRRSYLGNWRHGLGSSLVFLPEEVEEEDDDFMSKADVQSSFLILFLLIRSCFARSCLGMAFKRELEKEDQDYYF